MLTLAAFFLTLGILVTIHEFGHYWVAKVCGVKVLRFSVGFGRSLYSKRYGKDQTEFSISAIPLGGFVKMLDEREAEVAAEERHRAFNQQSVIKRIAIVAAGPIANLLLAIFLYWILFLSGVTGMKAIVGEVTQGSPAYEAGFKNGEQITKVSSVVVTNWQEMHWEIMQATINKAYVEIDTIDSGHHIQHRKVNMTSIKSDMPDRDVLDQLGFVPYEPVLPALVGEILPNSPAEKNGLKVGDLILAIDHLPIQDWSAFAHHVKTHPNIHLNLKVKRDQHILEFAVTPEAISDAGKVYGRIGAAFKADPATFEKYTSTIYYPIGVALTKAVAKTWDTSVFSLQMLGRMFTGEASWKGLSGPVTIASFAGQSAHIGWKAFVGFLALVSISLGVLNLLPVPVLDGGHLMYYMVELIKGSPVSESLMEAGQKIGFGLLGLLMLCAIYNDINRLITG